MHVMVEKGKERKGEEGGGGGKEKERKREGGKKKGGRRKEGEGKGERRRKGGKKKRQRQTGRERRKRLPVIIATCYYKAESHIQCFVAHHHLYWSKLFPYQSLFAVSKPGTGVTTSNDTRKHNWIFPISKIFLLTHNFRRIFTSLRFALYKLQTVCNSFLPCRHLCVCGGEGMKVLFIIKEKDVTLFIHLQTTCWNSVESYHFG